MAGSSGEEELKLLGTWPSPFVARVELALVLKGLTYEYVKEDLASKSGLLLASNPVHQMVPVLIHNGNAVCESRVILEYIDEAFPDAGDALLPADPYRCAVARFWAAYIDDKFVASWMPALRGKTEEERAEGMKQILTAAEALEGALGGNPFFGGRAAGLVDVVLGGLIPLVRATEVLTGAAIFDAARTPLLAAWADRFGQLDAAGEVLPDVDGMVEYMKMREAAADAAAKAAAN
ncbi:probable glutathione S-transferase GSTU6 [Oryza brachyantha]|uniref:Glutathione S-transferase n=1 Tax=Oryza brachyantha TaxID=4533 RepID=J3N240_ORYBR|nr:probable glutathione S-transferase GSTU6 [Oryza brachyantha]